MMSKRLQKDSEYDQYDMDGDGVVTDDELEHAKEIRQTETELRIAKIETMMEMK